MNAEVMISAEHRLMVVPYDAKLLNLFPGARKLGETHVAIPHGPDETRVMRNLGFMAPAPIHAHYNWPGTPPFKAQRTTAALLSVEPRAYVLSGLGTGKTRSCLYAFDFLKQQGVVSKMLVVAPLSTLNFTWRREIFQTFPHLRVIVLYGTKAKRLKLLAEDADIYVINHDGIKVLEDELPQVGIDIWCFDELTAFRNATAARSRVAQKLTRNASRVWGLTGTPMPKEPTDTFGQMRLITPDTSPKSFQHFRTTTMLQVNQFKWVAKPGSTEYVYGLMQPSVRFSLKDCVDMPPQIEVNREVQIGPEASQLYANMVKDMTTMVKNHEVTALNAGVLRGKLLQIASGIVYDKYHNPVVIAGGNRFDTLMELLEQTDRPALVFCPWRSLVEATNTQLKAAGVITEMVYGDTPARERDRIFSEVQREGTKLQAVVAHPGTMSHGLNLYNADTIIWMTLIDNLETYLQANARIQRPGQTASVTRICHLYGTKIEEIVLNRLRTRRSMQDALLELFEE